MSGVPETAHAIAAAIREGHVSAEEVAETSLARIAEKNDALGALTTVTAERALAEARTIDAKRAKGLDLPPLAGVPYCVKNLFDVAGVVTLAGSKINRDLEPAARDAVLVERMAAAGAVLVGAVNMGEYAYDFTGENAHYGAARNPLDPSRMSGGSSGGSGTAVGAGLAQISLASDTNGSIRVPSSFCGLYGLKPTYGRLPRTRTFPFCESLDHLGPIARSPLDVALAYDAMQGADAGDAASVPRGLEPVTGELAKGVAGLRVAVAGGYFQKDAEPAALEAVARVGKALGATAELDVPHAHVARAAAFLITNAESSAFHLDRLRTRAHDFDPDTRDRFLAGAMLPASWYIDAQRFRRRFAETMADLFTRCDLLIAPSTPCSAPLLGQKILKLGDREVPLRPNIGIYTQPISFVGLPVAAVPVFGVGAMPIGVQVIAPPWREDLCLRAAAALEQAFGPIPSPP